MLRSLSSRGNRLRLRRAVTSGGALLLFAGRVLALDLGDGRIHLRRETYDVATGPSRAAVALEPPAPGEVETWVVAIAGPADAGARRAIARHGGRIVGHVPSNAYLVRGTREGIDGLQGEPEIARADRYRPTWKIAPGIGARRFRDPRRLADGNRLLLNLVVFAGEDPSAAARRIRAAGAEVVVVHDAAGVRRVVARAPASLLPALARISEIEWIEEVGEITLRNDNVRWIIQSNAPGSVPLYDHGLFGEGEIVGHIDAPIAHLSCYFRDPADPTPGPNHRKLVAYHSSTGFGADWHGTHTAGTAAGDREPIDGSLAFRGMAPKARISHTSFFDVEGFGNAASNLAALLTAAHDDGAHVHTNSWGEDFVDDYTTLCVDIDTFTRNQEDDLVLFAVSNRASIWSPENAKNCLAVAATWGSPLQDQHGSGGAGPTADGRRKPEVLAPGVGTVSARNSSPCDTTSLTGTSAASPAVAGGALLVREYFRSGYYPTGGAWPAHARTPTGALLKAVVVNSTVDLPGVAGYPSAKEGWGRILLDDALYFPGDARRLWIRDVRHADGLTTGEVDALRVRVVDSLEPLACTMVFTDQPASLAAALTPVNDLDLEVEGPNGLFLGNVFDTVLGVSVPGGSPDPLNNVERVIVSVPAPGDWTIRVRGTDVPFEPQGYAIAVNGALFPAVPRTGLAPGESGPSPRVAPGGYRLEAAGPSPFRRSTSIRFAVPDRVPVRVTVHDVTGRLVRLLLDRTVEAGEYSVTWDGRDGAGRRAASGIYFTRLVAPGVHRTVAQVLLR